MTGKLEAESKLLSAARDALSLDPEDKDVLGPVQGEMKDLREVGGWMGRFGRSVDRLVC